MKRFDYYTVATATLDVQIANPKENVDAILNIIQKAKDDTQLIVFPELCITGYSCQDLFLETKLLQEAKHQLIRLTKEMKDNVAIVVGLPIQIQNHLYNVAAFISDHKILGMYVKNNLANYNECCESRWFSTLKEDTTLVLHGQEIPVSNRILFQDETSQATIGIEIGEDASTILPESSFHALAGATIIVNPSATSDTVGKKAYLQNRICQQSQRCMTGYAYVSAGNQESSQDFVFSGYSMMAENGELLAVSKNEELTYAQFDLQHVQTDRIHFQSSFASNNPYEYMTVSYSSHPTEEIELSRNILAYPFVPKDQNERIHRCEEILHIQAQGLATRLKKIHCKDVVIGISGGLDSTLAILVADLAYDLLGYDKKGIHAITMPGFGTTHRTKSNAQILMDVLGVSSEEISIAASVRQHFADISHDESVHDVTYENSQARERTQILMDLANRYNAIVVGTGDLSELALGWCTYNGDHMSMYAVNASVPKTLVRFICETQSIVSRRKGNIELADVLQDICDTPVSPELLPPDPSGKIQQKTEEVLGSYDLHDFFLYHMLRFHESPEKIYALAQYAFKDVPANIIKKAIQTFYWRFFTQQFKRNCMPDGIKVGSIAFSSRGDWRMPSDANQAIWSEEVKHLQ